MARVFLTIVLPLLLPTVLYVLWLMASQRAPIAAPALWRELPWPWLVAAGVALASLLLYLVVIGAGGPSLGTYVPPRYIDGQVVPGHLVPADPVQR